MKRSIESVLFALAGFSFGMTIGSGFFVIWWPSILAAKIVYTSVLAFAVSALALNTMPD